MKTETGEIISKKEELVREAMECGFQRFEAEAFYNCLRRFRQRDRAAGAKAVEEQIAWNMNASELAAIKIIIRTRGEA